jgi:hypothetical protein
MTAPAAVNTSTNPLLAAALVEYETHKAKADSFGNPEQEVANLISVQSLLARKGDDKGAVAAAAYLGTLITEISPLKDEASKARATLAAAKAMVTNCSAMLGVANPLKGAAAANGKPVKGARGYSYSIGDDTWPTVTNMVADLEDTTGDQVREAMLTALGNDRPDSVTFEVNGYEITAVKDAVLDEADSE